MRLLYKLTFVVIVTTTMFSCKTITSNRMFQTPVDYEYTAFSKTQKEYVIQPFDELVLDVFPNKASRLVDQDIQEVQRNNNRTQLKYRIEKDGLVKLPIIGWTNLRGYTVKEAQDFLEKEYQTYYESPFVYITVTNKRVIVFANGSSKGQVIKFSNDNFTLIEALAESGGISDFGKAFSIKLVRGDLSDPDIFHFNVRNLSEIKKANFQILSNDIIYVESRPRYASALLREITPFLSLLTSAFTLYILLSK